MRSNRAFKSPHSIQSNSSAPTAHGTVDIPTAPSNTANAPPHLHTQVSRVGRLLQEAALVDEPLVVALKREAETATLAAGDLKDDLHAQGAEIDRLNTAVALKNEHLERATGVETRAEDLSDRLQASEAAGSKLTAMLGDVGKESEDWEKEAAAGRTTIDRLSAKLVRLS